MTEDYISYKFIEIDQPVGTIYMGKLKAKDIYSISYSRVRTEDDKFGIQRTRNEDRIKDISTYCKDPDAIFPTPVILSGDSKYVNLVNDTIDINTGLLRKDNYKFSIVDGQHRLEGIHRSGYEDRFTLPIMILLDTTPEQDAYLFSIINGNQKPVSKSLVLDLFSLSSGRTVQKVCNYLVKQLNSDPDSSLYRMIKMLGVKSLEAPNATVSQATIVRNLMKYFTKDVEKDNLATKFGENLEPLDPDTYIFREYLDNEEDEVIYKILFNYFNAIDEVENRLLDDKTISFLQKTIGYTTKIQLLRPLYLKGLKNKSLTKGFFINEFEEIFKNYIKTFPSKKVYENYGSSDSGARNLYLDYILCWVSGNTENTKFITDADKKRLKQID
ncbi:DGQHR domain-containing protein [Peribacillus frigoritolerans]|uniref:DGQHR domain-containing protein n=1 Tax=Peribacillus frigoritolerans TaxID=450367 RepID=UPI002E238A1D|nr:DGQHR domain-containing protein [Peribacillus frigoritolerans]